MSASDNPVPDPIKSILAATGNEHKLLELATVAETFGIEIISPRKLQEEKGLPQYPDVEETADAYRENALLKARAFSEWAGMPALGDDSGLEVAALGNEPGVHSKRYAGDNASDIDRCNKILEELKKIEEASGQVDRSACFRCSLALVYPNGATLFADSILEGEVLYQPRGLAGFGYDPIVFLFDLGCTLAEVDFDVTCTEGFRARAAKDLFEEISSVV